uniref:Uncharacterized protein n=1 Tax=Panagrolaimus davidi TaxID=227884 RepID=A0A914R3M3_9BILA
MATLILWKANSNLKVIHHQTKLELSRRYQIDENIRMIQHVLPFLFIGAACLILSGIICQHFYTIFLPTLDYFTWPLVYFSVRLTLENVKI